MDAISWVLGEQSHKSLRAERMSDCIFNGTLKRPPLGMSEVIITLEDPELAEAGKFIFGLNDDAAAAQTGASTEAGPSSNDIANDPANDLQHSRPDTIIMNWRTTRRIIPARPRENSTEANASVIRRRKGR